MTLIYLINCDKCQADTKLATNNLELLKEIDYTCFECGHRGKGTKHYQTISQEKYLEGYEEVENKEKQN